MKRAIELLILLAIISLASGYLMSQMSFAGRLGINLVHKEYKFLKTWWMGAAVVYGALLALYLIQSLLDKDMGYTVAKIIHFLLFLAAIGGFYLTYADFDDDFTHKILRQRFHIGAYLFWVGWMLISLYFITKKRALKLSTISGNTPAANG